MRIPLSTGLACFVAVAGLIVVPTAKAYSFATGSVCQLSIPTTDTKFRPKATGARNESTTVGNFVVCPLLAPTATSNDYFTQVQLVVYSLDGASRDVSCTAVAGAHTQPGNLFDAKYSVKTLAVTTTGTGSYFIWTAGDFGGTAGDPIPSSTGFSVTCLLPPQTAINFIVGIPA